jgi:predicted aldo/keto reductase-like oxidoreductase
MASVRELPDTASFGELGRVCRLGLATRGNTGLDPADVLEAIRRGVTYLNWCGYVDGMSAAVRTLGSTRRDVQVAIQLRAHNAADARSELDDALSALGTDYLDVVTYYYLEDESEWDRIQAPDGAAEVLRDYQSRGLVRMVGVTTHQRALAAKLAEAAATEILMIRYNAAHRGAEAEVFPVAQRRGLPVVAYTALRWGALLTSTPDCSPDVRVPTALECYRFSLSPQAVAVCLAAPNGRAELEEDLTILDDWRGLGPSRYEELRAHGDRVRRHGGSFP